MPGARARLLALDPWTGERQVLAELAPRDRVGVVRIADAVITPGGKRPRGALPPS